MSKMYLALQKANLILFLANIFYFAMPWPIKASAMSSLIVSNEQGVPARICLTSAPRIDNFPEVALDFRLLDSGQRIVPNLSSPDIQAKENNSSPVPAQIISTAAGIGLNVYFVIDVGNRTDPLLVKEILRSFLPLLVDSKDDITIITDQENVSYHYLKTTESLADFEKSINSLPNERGEGYRSINNALSQSLMDIKNQNYGCLRSNIIVLIAGGASLEGPPEKIATFITEVKKQNIQMVVLHPPYLADSSLPALAYYESLARETYGIYKKIDSEKDIQGALQIFALDKERLLYTASYRTNNGDNGDHKVTLLYQNQDITEGSGRYSITISPPEIRIVSPSEGSIIQRIATKRSESGYLYDKNLQTVEFTVAWPDGHIRNIMSADLVIETPQGPLTAMSINPMSGVPLKFDWDIRDFATEKEILLDIKVIGTDEFGLAGTSQAVNLKIINEVPLDITLSEWRIYILYALVIVLVIAIIVMIIILRKKLSNIVTSGVVGKIIGEVRKTIVGGRHRKGNMLAKLIIIDGPAAMINKELPIYTESVKLGRDPEKADFVFFGPDASSSVSGLHCRLERVGGSWRIVALSTSGSETFVDDQAIPFNEPVSLYDSQTVRLGYLAQQQVVFKFLVEQGQTNTTAEPERITNVVDQTESSDLVNIEDIKQKIQTDQSESEDPFNEFRDRS